jgi:hypothetical protein
LRIHYGSAICRSNVLTWGTLGAEIALGVLVWNRRWRPWVLACGVALHLSISVALEVGFFSASMFVLYLAFIPPERAKKIADGVHKRLTALLARFRSRDVASGDYEDVLDVARRDTLDGRDDHVERRTRRTRPPAVPVSRGVRVHYEQDDRGAPDEWDVHLPPVSASRISAALDAINRDGQAPTQEDVARARRLADAPNGRSRREVGGVRTPAPELNVADEPTGRHGRHARNALSDVG